MGLAPTGKRRLSTAHARSRHAAYGIGLPDCGLANTGRECARLNAGSEVIVQQETSRQSSEAVATRSLPGVLAALPAGMRTVLVGAFFIAIAAPFARKYLEPSTQWLAVAVQIAALVVGLFVLRKVGVVRLPYIVAFALIPIVVGVFVLSQ